MTWLRRKRRPDPKTERAIKEAEQALDDAKRAYDDTMRKWPEVLEVGDLARTIERRNHLKERVEAVFMGRREQ